MNMNSTIPILQNNNNEAVTLIALPLQLFQQADANNSLIIDQSYFIKSLSDGTVVVDTNQLLNGNSNIVLTTISDPNSNNEKVADSSEPIIYTLQQKDDTPDLTNQVEEINKLNPLCTSDKKRPKARFFTSKSPIDVKKVGRPKKDSSKPNNVENDGPFKCKSCSKEFDRCFLLKKHEKSHINEKKYRCSSCPASSNILSNHLLHLAIHNTEDPTCPECGKKFQRTASLKAHIAYHEKAENYYCEECDILFHNENELNEHIKEHGQDKKVECDMHCKYCQISFTNQTEYKKHMSEHNKIRSILQTSTRKKPKKSTTIERKHECTICSKAFQKRSQIERHMRVHSGEKPYICKICTRGFSQKGSLQIHMNRHTGARPHKCALCQSKFSQKGNLRAHILKTHSIPQGGENVFSCSECSCVFKRLGSLNGHMTRNHPKEKNSDIKNIISQLEAMNGNMVVDNDILQQAIDKSDLPEVGNQNQSQQNDENTSDIPIVTYVTLADLGLDGNMRRYVIKQRRVGDIRWHLCSFCPKEFKKPSDLVRHLRVHTREKPYVCKFCCRSFAVKSTLTTHIRTHTKCTKVQCTYCYKFFSSWTTLNAHIVKHTCPKYKCSICNKSYRTTGKLNHHFQVHLNNHAAYYKEPNSNMIMLQPIQITSKGLQPVLSLRKRPLTEAGCRTRPYHCTVCGAAFRRLGHLKQHHVKHTGERPFRCHLCYRNFSSNSVLKNHILTHNGTKPYTCLICNKNFTTNGSLKRHLESHSNAKPFLCPYCFKDFKKLIHCRKHMQTHNLELNLQMETDDLTDTDLLNKTSELYAPDLADTLVDDPFSLVQPLTEPPLEEPVIDQQIAGEIQTSTPIVTQTLRADDTGTVVLPALANQENLTQENIQEIEDTLNSQMLNIIGNENFVDSATYINKISSEPIPTTDELVNTLSGSNTEKPIEENPFLYHQVIVNLAPESEQMPMFDSNGIENILSQVKLQNESLFLADLNSLNINNMNETNNVLLPFVTPQQDLPQNQIIMLPPDIEQEIQSSTLNTSFNLENIDQNLQLKLNAMNGFLNTTQNISDTNIALNQIEEASEISKPEDIVNETLPNIISESLPAKIIENNIVSDEITTENQVAPADIPTEKTNVTCNLCKLSFKSKNDLKVHQCDNFLNVPANSPEDTSRNEAEIINQINDEVTKEIFNDLIAKQDENDLPQLKIAVFKNSCTFCPKSFRKPSDLQRHLRTHTGERPFKCDECAKSFSLKSTLESHSKVHQGKKEFTCLVCNCLFATKGSLSVHMRLHTGIKPFKCPLCQLKFRTSGHRKAHLTVHYKEALRTGKIPSDVVTRKAKMNELMVQNILDLGEKQVEKDNGQLEDVPMQLTQQVADNIVLQTDEKPLMHFEIQTNTEGQIINIKPTASNILFVDETSKEEIISTQIEFDEKTKQQIENFLRDKKGLQQEVKSKIRRICNVCNKEFGTKYLLDRHSKIHTGERIYSCNYCTKTFNQKNALQAHVRTHLGTRPYCCPYCWNTFSQSGNLKTHIKRIHGGSQNKDTVNSGLITTNIQSDNLA